MKEMLIEYLKIGEIKPYKNNPRFNDAAVEQVANSIKEFGFKVPIIIDGENVIVAGHTRLKASERLGLEKVPCIRADDLTPDQIKAFRLADNKVSELATWDFEKLEIELEDIELDMSLFGFDDIDLEDVALDEDEILEDETPEPPEEPNSRYGDIYRLGKHVLMCGDATNAEDVVRLTGGGVINLLLTDPPYGVKRDKGFGGCGGFNGNGEPIPRRQYDDEWDSETPPQECFNNMLTCTEKAIIFGGNFFTDKVPVNGFWLFWDKHNTMPTFGDGELAWTNIKRQSVKKYDVEYNGLIGKEKERFHPTQKPVKLFVDIIEDFTEADDSVLDLFGGSGTTLIACETTGRKCYMMEREPKYIDVIIQRWETLTGEKAERIPEAV